MNATRRRFLMTALSSGAVAATVRSAAEAQFLSAPRHGLPGTLKERYAKLDAILKEPAFRRSLFPDPVIIEPIELLHNKKQYLCRVRSKDGHEGISVSNAQQMEVLYPMFNNELPYHCETSSLRSKQRRGSGTVGSRVRGRYRPRLCETGKNVTG